MSLVERAIKKLQDSKQSTPIETASRVSGPVPSSAAGSVAQGVFVEASPVERSSRVVHIDRDALRGMDLLPPKRIERQIASQYQQIKRPLVASALGQGEAQLPRGNIIMLASALPREGKTFTSINLALSMAREKDVEVLLVDADVAKPHVSKIFNVEGERGLLDLLTDSRLHPESLILRTDVPGLSILPAGTQTETATELLASERMNEITAELAAGGGNRIVLLDSPPLLLSTESRALVGHVGQVLMVVRAYETAQKAVMDALDALGESKPISLVLNQTNDPPSSGYYGYGTYGADSEQAK